MHRQHSLFSQIFHNYLLLSLNFNALIDIKTIFKYCSINTVHQIDSFSIQRCFDLALNHKSLSLIKLIIDKLSEDQLCSINQSSKISATNLAYQADNRLKQEIINSLPIEMQKLNKVEEKSKVKLHRIP